MTKLKHVELYDAFKELDQNLFDNVEYLSKFIMEKAGLSLNPFLFDNANMGDIWGGVKTRQYPQELAKLMRYVYLNRHKINSYMEVGMDFGGTFFIMDSFLRSFQDNYEGSLGIDVKQKFGPYFKEYTDKFPNCKVELPLLKGIYNLKIDKVYDLCFIDALHAYRHVQRDHAKYAPNTKILAFHDIKLRKVQQCVADYWPEIKTAESIELLNEDKRFVIDVGIGILNP